MSERRRNFANISRIASGRYQVKYTGPDGVRRYAPHTFARREDAETFVGVTRRAIDRGKWSGDAPTPTEFGEYTVRWLANRQVKGRPIADRTREHYQNILDQHLLPEFGDQMLSAIKPAQVRKWYEKTLVDRPTMRSHTYSLLRTIFQSAIDDEDLIDVNPCRIRGAGRTERVHEVQTASASELAALTAAMPERWQLMVVLLTWCALRFGETVELRRGDIDLIDEKIRVRRAVVRVKGGRKVKEPKWASVRDVTIPPHLIPLIEVHLAEHVGRDRAALLFPSVKGEQLQPSTVYRHWYKARDAAGRPDLRIHDLRHTGLTLTAATGASIAELMERGGHSSSQAALRYQHAARGRDREIAALLSKLADTP